MCLRWFWSKEREGGRKRGEGREKGREEGSKRERGRGNEEREGET